MTVERSENIAIKNNKSFCFFAIGALFVMFDSFHLQFVRWSPVLLFPVLGGIIMLFYYLFHPSSFNFKQSKGLVSFFAVICIYQLFFCTEKAPIHFILYIFTFVCGLFVIGLADDYKKILILFTSKILAFILLFSIAGWMMYLLHIPMPHHTVYDGVFYTHTFYPTFTVNGYPYQDPIPRFTAVFQEPGHLASTCVFLLFINKMDLRRWYNLVMFVSVLLSLSLGGYGLLVGAILLYTMLYSRHRTIAVFLFVILCSLITFVSVKLDNGNNILYQVIISRLEYSEDKGIAGNNRYSKQFEGNYSKFVKSDDLYFGLGDYPQNKKWWTNSAGWKRALVTNGLVGVVLVVLFYFVMTKKRKACLSFFLIWLVSNMIRDHLLKEFWLYIFICAMPLLSSYPIYVKKRKTLSAGGGRMCTQSDVAIEPQQT